METPVTFLSRAKQLVGMLHSPDASEPAPAVVFLHGFRGNRMEQNWLFVQMARSLAEVGIASLRFDFGGSGESEGSFADMTHESEIADALTAVAFLREQPGVDADRIGLVGMSFGGAIGAAVLGREEFIRSAVLWCPVAHPAPLAKIRTNEAMAADLERLGYADYEGFPVGRRFLTEIKDFHPLQEITACKAPVLLIHGSEDDAVPVSESEHYQRVLEAQGQSVALEIIDGAGHTYDALAWQEQVKDATRSWFKETLQA